MRKFNKYFSDEDNEKYINRKVVSLLKRYLNRFGNIKARKYVWNRVKHQKALRKAIIRARQLWILPYIK